MIVHPCKQPDAAPRKAVSLHNMVPALDTTRLLYIVDHPIQYQAPLLQRLEAESSINLRVAFRHLGGANRQFDQGFGRDVVWDIPLLEGYDHTIVPRGSDLAALIEWSDVVWLHGWQGSWMRKALLIAARKKRPLLMRGENTDNAMPDGSGPRGWLKQLYLKRIFTKCTAFLCIGSDNRRYYQHKGISENRLFSMPYAVDNSFFQSRAEKAVPGRGALRTELGLQPGRPIVLFAGKLSKRKNPIMLLQAFLALDRAITKEPYLLFVGDGELREELIKAAAANPAIKFAGFRNQTEMPGIYDLADIFVLASHREPWGLAVNEAMNASCTIIVSNDCGCAADLVDQECGRIVPAGSQKHLAAALTELLSSPAQCANMGLAAKRKVTGWGFDRDITGLKLAIDAVKHGIDRS